MTYKYKDTRHRKKVINQDIKYWFTKRLNDWKKRGPKNIKCDLTVRFLLNLYTKQKGRCYYSNSVMVIPLSGKSEYNGLSLDRRYPKKGYVKGNVVFCTFFCNTMKGKLNEKEFYLFIENILKHRNKI